MKTFMVVVHVCDREGEYCDAYFTDEYNDAENMRMNAVCGLGAEAEVYVRNTETFEYEFLYC